MKQEAPSDPPPSLPPFVKYVLAPAFTGFLWFFLGPFGVLFAATAWIGWYVYEGYAEATMQ